MSDDKIICKFRKNSSPYNAGEIAGFHLGAAQDLFRRSVVNFVDKNGEIIKRSPGQIEDDAKAEARRQHQEAIKAKVDKDVERKLKHHADNPEPKPIRERSPNDDPTMTEKEKRAFAKKTAKKTSKK